MQILAQNQIIENVAKLMTAFTENQVKDARRKKKSKRFKSKPVSINVSLSDRDTGLYNVGPSLHSQDTRIFGSNKLVTEETRIEMTEPNGQPHLTKSAIIDLISSKLQVPLLFITI